MLFLRAGFLAAVLVTATMAAVAGAGPRERASSTSASTPAGALQQGMPVRRSQAALIERELAALRQQLRDIDALRRRDSRASKELEARVAQARSSVARAASYAATLGGGSRVASRDRSVADDTAKADALRNHLAEIDRLLGADQSVTNLQIQRLFSNLSQAETLAANVFKKDEDENDDLVNRID